MIRKYSLADNNLITNIINQDQYQNPYLYIDLYTYGYRSPHTMTWLLECNHMPKAILYKYYNSLQLFHTSSLTDNEVSEIVTHIRSNNYEMISGSFYLLDKIQEILSSTYNLSHGYILDGSKINSSISTKTQWASPKHCEEIATLICSDESIGGHYSIPLLTKQLEERMLYYNCKSRILIQNNAIISHMATYAEVNNIAILGGLVTQNSYRGQGLGKIVLSDITQSILREKKTPVLYCYKNNLINWYISQGWHPLRKCAKLEKIH